MARKTRIHLPGGLYHVILRGNGGQPVFLSEDDRYRFYLLLQEGTRRYDYLVHAFCLMTNHIHLALESGNLPLSRGIQNLSFRYTRWINRREKRTGHLFQGRYKAVLVDMRRYLPELVRYLHLNPVRTGMVEDPLKYPWSSHRAYLGREILPWLTTDRMLKRFGKSLKQARTGYETFMGEGLKEGHRPEFYGGDKDSRVLGDNGFVNKCLSPSGTLPPRRTAREIVERVCLAYKIDNADLQAQSQRRTASEARAVVGWLARELGCATLTHVGRLVHRDVGSMSSSVRRLSDRMEKDPQLDHRVRSLKKLLENES